MRAFRRPTVAFAHCDLPCGVYDPAQARIEAESVKAIQQKYQDNEDPVFRTRALISRSSAPSSSSTTSGCCGPTTSSRRTSRSTRSCTTCSTRRPRRPARPAARASVDPAEGQKLLDLIAEIDTIFWETKKAA